MKIKTIPINQIKENAWNPNEIDEYEFQILMQNIKNKKIGYTQPIEVRQTGKKQYQVVDGAHRLRACKEAGLTEIQCVVSNYDNTEAKLETLAKNKLRGTINLVEAANLIAELNQKISLDDIGGRIGFKKRELEDSLRLFKIPLNFEIDLKKQAEKEKLEAPITLEFIVTKEQAKIVESAVNLLCEREKIKRGRALELICADFLAGA
jgi:ParB family chromosome partitioning protein